MGKDQRGEGGYSIQESALVWEDWRSPFLNICRRGGNLVGGGRGYHLVYSLVGSLT